MKEFGKLFDKETVENISNMIENKMYVLNNVKDFHDKDQAFAIALEKLESSLSSKLNEQVDNVMRLNYQVEAYYFTLAYFLGIQHGKQASKL